MHFTAELVRRTTEEDDMPPKEPEFIGEAPFLNRLPGGLGEVIGNARIENLHGKLIAHIDMAGKSVDILRQGFSFGEISLMREDEE